jgi:predicted DsbA family dithiol-disulfide isomerase
MENIDRIRNEQIDVLKSICSSNGIDYDSMKKLLESERVKKLQKRNHYIQQTINSEIEKVIENENK